MKFNKVHILEDRINNLPHVSIIILNWNAKSYLKKCMDSILCTDYPKDLFDVLVVDNGSTDNSAEFVKENYPEVNLIRNQNNIGFCKGNNVGINIALGDIIILINNDTIVDRNWIRKILNKFKDPKVGIVGCQLFYPGTRIIQSLGYREKFLGYWENLGEGEEYDERKKVYENVDYVLGAALAISKEVVQKIGLLDPHFEYVEDLEWCYRARKAGYEVVMSDAIVYHFGSVSLKKIPSIRFYLRFTKSLHYLIQKYYPPISLLRYMFEYPIKISQVGFHRLARGKTKLKKIAIYDKDSQRKHILLNLLCKFILNIIVFYISLFIIMKDK